MTTTPETDQELRHRVDTEIIEEVRDELRKVVDHARSLDALPERLDDRELGMWRGVLLEVDTAVETLSIIAKRRRGIPIP